MPTRPGHVTLSILLVALMWQSCPRNTAPPAPFLCQPIDGSTRAAGSREMGLRVSHDRHSTLLDCQFVSACLLRPSLQQKAGSAIYHDPMAKNTTLLQSLLSPCYIWTCTIIFTAALEIIPSNRHASVDPSVSSVVGVLDPRPPTSSLSCPCPCPLSFPSVF
jgi:hypothetical protein